MPLLLDSPAAAVSEGRLFMARAVVTAMGNFSVASGTGGPFLWNPGGNNKTVVRLWRMGYAITTASTVAGALGLTGGTQGSTGPSSPQAIDSLANMQVGCPNTSQINAYRFATPSAAGGWFMPLAQVTTAALTAELNQPDWIDLSGFPYIPPGGWVSVAASAALTTSVIQISLVYEELFQS